MPNRTETDLLREPLTQARVDALRSLAHHVTTGRCYLIAVNSGHGCPDCGATYGEAVHTDPYFGMRESSFQGLK